MAEAVSEANRGQALGAGTFYGVVERKREQCGAIFTELRHTSPRKLPSHSHELAFFGLLLEGEYGERYLHQETQFRPFTLMFRPGGIPHQDEIGPHGVRLFEIEVRPRWHRQLEDCSAALDRARDDCHGGELLWLGMKLFCELHGADDDLSVESLLAELLASAARTPQENFKQPPVWLTRVVEKLAVEHSHQLTLDELSSEAAVHPVHLSRVFRKFVGEGIGEYVHRLRIRAACEQMLAPGISLADISLATGFADQSHFTRAFRKVTGMTPAAFRTLVTTRSQLSAVSSWL
jgi:AraC family transcriptional regulator